MATTSWYSPGTVASVDRDSKQSSWNNTSNVQSQSDTYSRSINPSKNDYSDWLRCTNFGLDAEVPAGATIDGVEVEMDAFAGGSGVTDSAVYLRKTAGQTGDNKAAGGDWPTSDTDTYRAWGGAADDWNATLDADDVRSSDFGVDYSVYADGGGNYLDADHVRIRVTYTDGKQADQTFFRMRRGR